MELNQDQLKEGKSYVVMTALKFEGTFTGFVQKQDGMYAIFEQDGRTDRGNIPLRSVKVVNIIEVELSKRDE